MSPRRKRIERDGLIALTAQYAQQALLQSQGKVGAPPDSFRVQTYNVTLKKPAEFSVKAVYGFGRSKSKWLAAETGIFGHCKLSRMRESQRTYIRRSLNQACIQYDDPSKAAGAALKKEIGLNIQRLKDIRCYRGIRHMQLMPCRGQRTKTNAKTRKKMGRNY